MTFEELNEYYHGLQDVPYNMFIKDLMKKYRKPRELEEVGAAFLSQLDSTEEELFQKMSKPRLVWRNGSMRRF